MNNEIVLQKKNEFGIRRSESGEVKFYTFKGIPSIDLLNWIDDLNKVLDFEPLRDEQVLVIAKFIMYEFSTLTISDLERAIFKAKSGKLKCDPKDYGKLSIDYFGRILTAYTIDKNRKNMVKKPRESKVLYESIDAPKNAYELIKRVYEEEGKEPFIANWVYAFYYMQKNEIIKMDNDEKEMFADNVRFELEELVKNNGTKFVKPVEGDIKHILQVRGNKKGVDDARGILQSSKRFKNECRKRIVKSHFEAKL